jgi:diacylglycerol kinase
MSQEPAATAAISSVGRPRRTWQAKFGHAWRGVKWGVRGHSSFFVHFFFACLVVGLATILVCERWEWCLLLGCIGLVFTAELFNSAIETLFRGLPADVRDQAFRSLDIAAGAVLVASLTAAVVGLLILAPRLLAFLGWWPAV